MNPALVAVLRVESSQLQKHLSNFKCRSSEKKSSRLLPYQRPVNTGMTPSQNCYDLIKRFEGFRAKAYLCPAGILTIGFGHTGTDVLPGMIITKAQADALLIKDVQTFAALVQNALTTNVTQGQFDALVSFCFNTGPGRKGIKDGLVTLKNGNPSSLLRLTNAGDTLKAAEQFKLWVKADGKVLPGLVTRREAERLLYLS